MSYLRFLFLSDKTSRSTVSSWSAPRNSRGACQSTLHEHKQPISQRGKRVGERTYCESIIEVWPVVENQLWAETTPEYVFC